MKDVGGKPNRLGQYVRSFERALEAYLGKLSGVDHPIPLRRFLTEYFKENRQMGSKDRRAVSRYLYHYFRLGQALPDWAPRERLIVAEFLCADESALIEFFVAEQAAQRLPDDLGSGVDLVSGMQERLTQPLEEKIVWLEAHSSFRLDEVFPGLEHASADLDSRIFAMACFWQPDLFLRIRRGQEKRVKNLLEQHSLPFRQEDENILALPNGTSLEKVGALKGLIEVQDLSSQRSLEDLQITPGESWWDACSGAGGKSLQLMDKFPDTRLLVSDHRPSILRNLDERFDQAGVTNYRRKIIDLSKDTAPLLGDERFDGILLDLPCSGSGTWGRTPEMLHIFQPTSITYFSQLQLTLSEQALKHLRPGGQLIYITCSVFKAENEQVVEQLAQKHGLEIHAMNYKIGYKHRADTLFVGILHKIS